MPSRPAAASTETLSEEVRLREVALSMEAESEIETRTVTISPMRAAR